MFSRDCSELDMNLFFVTLVVFAQKEQKLNSSVHHVSPAIANLFLRISISEGISRATNLHQISKLTLLIL